MWIKTGVTVRKRLSWIVTSVTLTFDLWPWPFAWTSLLSLVINPENFMMIRWWEHSKKVWRTDGRTDWTIHRAAWSQLKTSVYLSTYLLRWPPYFLRTHKYHLSLTSYFPRTHQYIFCHCRHISQGHISIICHCRHISQDTIKNMGQQKSGPDSSIA